MRKKEAGSAHVIIIVILSLALIGAVGTLFWQNVLQKKNDDKQVKAVSNVEDSKKTVGNDTSTSVDLKEVLTSNVDNYTITLNYPSNWTLKRTDYNYNGGVLTSANGKVNIAVSHTVNDGLGGTGPTPVIDSLKRIELSSASNDFDVVQFTSKYDDEAMQAATVDSFPPYKGGAGVVSKGHIAVGDYWAGGLMWIKDNSADTNSPVFHVLLESSSKTNNFADTLFSTDEYKEGLAVLKSFKVAKH